MPNDLGPVIDIMGDVREVRRAASRVNRTGAYLARFHTSVADGEARSRFVMPRGYAASDLISRLREEFLSLRIDLGFVNEFALQKARQDLP